MSALPQTPAPTGPTAGAAAPAREAPADVLAPATLGPLRLRNRVVKAATFEGMSPQGVATDRLVDFHRAVAAGGTGMTTVAFCAVTAGGRSAPGEMIMRADAVAGLRRLADAVHAEGAAVSAQLGHAGPVADSRRIGEPALSASRQFRPLGMTMTRVATEEDLRAVIAAHANAAKLAEQAGFDAVEIHLGHNYLASSFLSRRLNRRDDAWGGSLQNRARLGREIARAVREAVGGRLAVTAKFNMDDGFPGGVWLDESLQVAQWLEQDGSLDALELTVGSSLKNPMYLFKGDAPLEEFAAVFPQPFRSGVKLFGDRVLRSYPYRDLYMLDDARQFRAALDMPLILLGGVTDRPSMDTAMAAGFDFVAMGRALLREPDLVNRIADDATTPSLCVHCNKCMPTIYRGTHCVLAPPRMPETHDGTRS